MSKNNGFGRRLLILLVLAFGIKLWYENLDQNHKRFVNNIIKQIPELPGRYSL
jgi:hypothetical protein